MELIAKMDTTVTDDATIQVEVVYGLAHKQKLLSLPVKIGSTVEQVINESGILTLFSEIDLAENKVGIWNKAVKLSQLVENLDRIEIYRPLILDPKEMRRKRAAKKNES